MVVPLVLCIFLPKYKLSCSKKSFLNFATPSAKGVVTIFFYPSTDNSKNHKSVFFRVVSRGMKKYRDKPLCSSDGVDQE